MLARIFTTVTRGLHRIMPRRLLTAMSVRARIAALAMIPVVGFIANGINYFVSEHEIGRAFDAVSRSNTLTDSSRDLRAALNGVRFATKEMAVNPSASLVKALNDHHTVALQRLESIPKKDGSDDSHN